MCGPLRIEPVQIQTQEIFELCVLFVSSRRSGRCAEMTDWHVILIQECKDTIKLAHSFHRTKTW